MARHPHVTEVHDLHVWEIGSGFAALSAHVLVEPDADCHGLRRELEARAARALRRSTTRRSRSTTPSPTACCRSGTASSASATERVAQPRR